MNKIKILIVEDELIIANDLKDILEGNNYEVCRIARSYQEGVDSLETEKPDMALLDIHISGIKDGIELGGEIRSKYAIPFIIISSHTDQATLTRAKEIHPYGFLVKPFEDEDVLVAIEMALNNFSHEQVQKTEEKDESNFVINKSLFVRQKDLAIKVPYEEILYAKADANYCTVYTTRQQFVLRSTLKDLEGKLQGQEFYRSHRSFLINLTHLQAINSDIIIVGKEKLPVGREQQVWLMEHINKI